ncbi:helix-turn-helix domain-containing protein [Maribacter luteus]|uniref:Helix-turn-helix domain-containing protein n=1 Tax=Maribacter luteus TaxID=2594478 RepID=A0A6I2MRC3_9FLAO|nr:helix-turn-helix domain-containing protein [Maribacter luteus]MRX64734.1 helix-turn-helix domain-containing protein [Maribacter luteus]
MESIININRISEVHKVLELQSPQHPLISIFSTSDNPNVEVHNGKYRVNLYMISLKTMKSCEMLYGRNSYDYQEGTLIYTAPGQVIAFEAGQENSVEKEEGWTIVFHPDLIRHSNLAQTISEYLFFDYGTHEALHVSEKEKRILLELINNIKREISDNIDKHSQELININLESLLKYSNRFYDRQFYTRTNLNKGYLVRFEKFLKDYFASGLLINQGLPTVQQCGEALNMSGYYLSDLLKVETGKSTKEHITLYMVEQAKTKLLGSNSSVSEIAFDFGFEYPQHFSKLFKSKTGYSPSEYRTLN